MRVGVLGLLLVACGGDNGSGGGRCEIDYSVAQNDPMESYETSDGRDMRKGCLFHEDSKVTDSVGPAVATMFPTSLEHVIVLLRENRSFDNLLGGRPQQIDMDWNPDPSAPREAGDFHKVHRFHETHYCTASPDHEWGAVHLQYNNGQLNGFVTASNRSATNQGGCVAMGYYNSDDVPLYYWLADTFAISDDYHASLLGPTIPNLLYYFYASSCGNTDNDQAIAYQCKGHKSIFKLLSDNNIKYAVYSASTLKSLGAAIPLTDVDNSRVFGMAQYATDLANNQLPPVVFIEPNYKHLPGWLGGGTQNDEHPPSNVQDGQLFVHGVLTKLMASSAWMHSIVFITWDEHGGYFDHVQPPDACSPGDLDPGDFPFNKLGFRTPFFAVSPFAIKGHVSHHTADHSSILRFIEAWKGLGALTDRDANAWPLLDMFDFVDPPRTDVGSGKPDPAFAFQSVDPTHIMYCGTGDEGSCCNKGPACAGGAP